MVRAKTTLFLALILIGGLALAPFAFAQGKPVQPGNATADGFLPSSSCGCHAARVQEWAPSMHAKAIADPVFLLKVAQAQAEVGEEVTAFCKRCHSPIGNMTGDPLGEKTPAAAEGVTCMYCHQVVGIDGKPANTSHLVEANLTRRAQLKDPAAPHPAAYSELHTKAEFCGGCHDVNHPGNGTHLETSYSEWAASPYAKEGVVCQDCHMNSKPGVVGPSKGTACAGGKQRDNIFAMSFVGANVGQGPAEASSALLKSAATVEVSMPEVVPGGSATSLTVTVKNVGAGHYLPTGLTEERQMWLSVYSEGADGSKTDIGERRFGTVLKDAKGAYPAEMWNAVAVQSDDRIPPRGSVASDYTFTMPQGAKQAKVVAVLSYKSIPDELATQANVANPVTEMAALTKVVYASQAEKDAAPKPVAPTESPAAGGVNWLPFAIGVVIVAVLAVATVAVLRSRKS